MPLVIPKIVYDSGSGAVMLTPTYPNTQKPMMDDIEGVRHDSYTSSGLPQFMTERVDSIKPVNMENVLWEELPQWAAFFQYAVQGGQFQYYPDSTASAFATYTLLDPKVNPQYVCRGLSKFSFKIRKVPGGASSA